MSYSASQFSVKPVDTKIVAGQMPRLEADVNLNLVGGSIKGCMKDLGVKANDLWMIEPHKLRVIPDFNPRVRTVGYLRHIRALAESMKSEGFYRDKPLAGYVANEDGQNVVYVYDGGSRLEAAQLAISEGATFEKIPVTVDQKGLAQEDMLVAMVRSNTGRPLTAYENGLICKRLARMGMSEKDIAARLGFSAQYTTGLLSLMSAPLPIREMVAAEMVSSTLAIEVLAEHGSKALEILEKAMANAKSQGKTRLTEKHIAGTKAKKALVKAAPDLHTLAREVQSDPAFLSLAPALQEKLALLLAKLEQVEMADVEKEDSGEGEGAELRAA